MGRKRGFFAELQHQAAVAERNRHRTQAVGVREQVRRAQEAERAYAAAQRARQQAAKADARASAEALREAKRLHIAAQESRVESMNADLEMRLSEIDDILSATLSVDDYVDLDKLRKVVEHLPFTSEHQEPTPAPDPIEAPPEPVFVEPEAPKGLSALFGKKKHAEAVAEARRSFEAQHRLWEETVAAVPMRQLQQLMEHKAAEEKRVQKLAEDRAKYDDECRKRQRLVDEANERLGLLIQDYGAGKAKAVEEYIGIVFGNSVYPDDFPWDVEYEYDEATRELRIDLEFPRPDQVPTTRQYRYVKAKDEISETPQTAREQRERYTNLVQNLVLRTLHEIWESDRSAQVQSISLAGGVQHIDPAVGRETFTPLIALAVDRETFATIDLAHVTPAETLKHLNAVVSKNPHALVPIDTSQGVRGH